ncbi:hypothetical protein SEA_BIPPER_31 [Mycobacterium phage Bipper]|uniref:Uncharacterized protein n=1 Tax=Mycobacterium phage Bipper TaxID=1805457 RepID=A0A142F2G0_9CAUD|nr:hypothetical protein KCH39_gp031 [Mycobacterium phage Bipper]AMQ66967.1 hypothetical protein SEA_BIPPER_31 [Mycobacterium phage Bipper]
MMTPLRPGDRLWIGLLAYVVGANVWATTHNTEMLSEVCDRQLKVHRWLTEVVLAALYCHLSNRVPDRYDPIHWLFVGVKATATRLMRKEIDT